MLWLTVVLFAMTVLEIVVLVKVSAALGGMITVLMIIGFSAVGAWVVKHEGMTAWKRVLDDVRAGRMPTASFIDGFLVVMVGVLLLTPGFISTGVGLVLAIPAVRRGAGARLAETLSSRVARQIRIVGAGLRDNTTFTAGAYDAYAGTSERVDRGDFLDLDGEEVFVDEILELGPGDGE